jgi:hypothetical protein
MVIATTWCEAKDFQAYANRPGTAGGWLARLHYSMVKWHGQWMEDTASTHMTLLESEQKQQ